MDRMPRGANRLAGVQVLHAGVLHFLEVTTLVTPLEEGSDLLECFEGVGLDKRVVDNFLREDSLEVRTEQMDVFCLVPGHLETDQVAFLGLPERRGVLEPRVLGQLGRDNQLVALGLFWLVDAVRDSSIVEARLLDVALVHVHEGETFVSEQLSLCGLDCPGECEHIFEADNRILVLFHLREAVRHLLQRKSLSYDVSMSVGTVAQFAVELQGQGVDLCCEEHLSEHRVALIA